MFQAVKTCDLPISRAFSGKDHDEIKDRFPDQLLPLGQQSRRVLDGGPPVSQNHLELSPQQKPGLSTVMMLCMAL